MARSEAENKDPYVILGVKKSASQDEIRDAYRKLAKKLHPDLNPNNQEAEKTFKGVTQAYDILGDKEKRARFDRGEIDEQAQERPRAQERPSYAQTQGAGARYSSGFEGMDNDFFESIFGGRGGAARGGGKAPSFAGEDVTYRMDVDFKTAALGAEQTLHLPGGKRLQVKIPGGVETGNRLRFKGQGGPGYGANAAAGDAYVEIHVLPSQEFRRIGTEIESDLEISLADAILGGEVPVATLEGRIMLKVPETVANGARLKIRGRGIKKPDGTRGDHIAVIQVQMPKTIDPELKEFMQRWREKNASPNAQGATS